MKRFWLVGLILGLLFTVLPTFAQSDLAATMEVLSPGVEVMRAGTANWIAVRVEAIVGVGDHIRTDATGEARITYFADGVDTTILPNTEYAINTFSGDAESFNIEAEVVAGQTTQRLTRLLDAGSSYSIETPAMSLVARGTEFAIRVEASGRAAMLVQDGTVEAGAEDENAAVPPGFGIRAEETLSDVVQATSFDALDSALDGCTATLTTPDDVSINVRQGASTDFLRIGTIDAGSVTNLKGTNETGDWYRIDFRGGFGWILSTSAAINEGCAGLRTFPDSYGPEDASLYSEVGDPVNPEDLQQGTPSEETPEAEVTPEATESP